MNECKPLLCGALRTLNLHSCRKLVFLPAEIGHCADLRTLILAQCYALTSVPAELGRCASLHTLDLAGRSFIHSSTSQLNLSRV